MRYPYCSIPVNFDLADLKGLEAHQIFRHPRVGNPKAFSKARAERGAWVDELVRQIHLVLDRYGLAVDERKHRPESAQPVGWPDVHEGTETAENPNDDRDGPTRSVLKDLDRVGHRLIEQDVAQHGLSEAPGHGEAVQRVPVVDHLVAWALDQSRESPSLLALLGELGMGKTIKSRSGATSQHRSKERTSIA